MRPRLQVPSVHHGPRGRSISWAAWRVALVAVALSLAACSAPAATIPPDATGSIQAPTTATAAVSASSEPSPAAAFPVTLTGYDGVSVELSEEPQRIVSLTPAATETLFALGVGDRIVGKANDFFLYPPEASAVPDVQAFEGIELKVDVERIVSLEPDLVIAGSPQASLDALRNPDLGLEVLVVYAPSVQAVFDDIELLGRAVGKSAEGTAMTGRMRSEFEAVEAAVASAPRLRLFYELDATGAFYGPSDESFLAEMIEIAGAEPITTGSPDKFDIPVERLIDQDPEVILLADAAFGVTAEQVAARPGWDVMTAVKTGDIRPIDDQTVTRPGPRLFLGLQLLASTIHPDLAIPSSSPIPAVP